MYVECTLRAAHKKARALILQVLSTGTFLTTKEDKPSTETFSTFLYVNILPIIN